MVMHLLPAPGLAATTSSLLGRHLSSLRTMTSDSVAALSPIEAAKRLAARKCAEEHVKSGMTLGVGSGSTVKYLVQWLGEKQRDGSLTGVRCVPTSYQTKLWLLDQSLSVVDLDAVPSPLDVCIDGADEVDAQLVCIKGGGGCLGREKIVQSAATRFFVIADHTKDVAKLGDRFDYLPIEVIPFAASLLLRTLPTRFGGKFELRLAKSRCGPVVTDDNNYVIDWHFPKDKHFDWPSTHRELVETPGIVETGLFFNCVQGVYFAQTDGTVTQRGAHS